jgi:hypothetical protein
MRADIATSAVAVQIAASIVGVVALGMYSLIAIRLSTYSTPWGLPWQGGSMGGRWPAINAAIRFGVFACVGVLVAWPSFRSEPVTWGRESGLGFFPSAGIQRAPNLTWLAIVVTAAGLFAVGLLVAWLLSSRRENRGTDEASASDAPDQGTLGDLTDEILHGMMLERDPRRAILACYAQMERTWASRGIPRKPDETPLEYMRRLLEQAGAASDPQRSLTELFQVAGFSVQSLDEPMRETAIRALQAMGAGGL